MELKKVTHDHVALNDGQAIEAVISEEFVSHAIKMLTKQYSDPEMAFMRETCSNAYDAHKVAGTEDVPFDLHIPSTFSPYMEIRDYGTGLSKEFMETRYMSVGDSTKRQSNAQIGGFGIGRLSFLTVTEQASITSYFDGMKYTYNMRYNEQGNLVISLTDERETDEPNGLRLKFPVQTNRVEAFRQAAKNYFKRVTSTLPNFKGDELNIERTEYSYTGTNWGIRKNDGSSDLYAIMGNIAYPVKTNTLRWDDRFADVRQVLDSRIDLFFDIGEVIPLPTRENLDMCDHTLDALLVALTQLNSELIVTLQDSIKDAKTPWQAARAYSELTNGLSYEMNNIVSDLKLSYGSQRISTMKWTFYSPRRDVDTGRVDPDGKPIMQSIPTLTFYARGRSGYNATNPTSWQRGNTEVSANHGNYLTHCFIFNDTGKGIRPTIDYNYPNRDTNVVMVAGDAQEWERFKTQEIEKGFNPRCFKLASKLLPKPKRPKRTPNKASIAYIASTTRLPTSTGVKSWCSTTKYEEVTDQAGYYVYASNYQLSPEDFENMKKLRSLIETGMLEPIDILVLNKNRQHLQDDEDGWKHFSKYIKVDKKKLARKRKAVYRTCYHALRYNRMYQLHTDNFTDRHMTDSKRWYYGGNSGYQKVLSWKGQLVRDFDKQSDIDVLRYLISTSSSYLETARADRQLEPLVKKVIGTNYDVGHDTARNLCVAFGIDYEKLKEQADREYACEESLRELINSQTYRMLNYMSGRHAFDYNKLKKELKNVK